LALKGLHKIHRSLNDLVNTKEKREFILIVCVPFYILYGISILSRNFGVFTICIVLWFAFLYLFFFQTERGKELRKIVEEQ